MGKQRQEGQLFRSHGKWYLRYYTNRVVEGTVKRVRVAKVVCTAKKVTRERARELAGPMLDDVNRSAQRPEAALSVVSFTEEVFLPLQRRQKKASTAKAYESIWNNYLKPHCRSLWLNEVKCHTIQQMLDDIAAVTELERCAQCKRRRKEHPDSHEFVGQLTKNTLKHIKVCLSAIFKVGKQLGYYTGENPVRDSAVPPGRESAETSAYTLAEVQTMLGLLPEPSRTVVALAAFSGLRRGELMGLRWQDYDGKALHVRQSVWNGVIGKPKTTASRAPVPVIEDLRQLLEFHRARMGNPDGQTPIFTNAEGHAACLNNMRTREIIPALTRCAHCHQRKDEHDLAVEHDFKFDEKIPKWRGWHGFRRGLGTVLYQLGVGEKVIQKILRHSNVSTTSSFYIKSPEEDARAAMNKLENAILNLSRTRKAELPRASSTRLQ